MLVAKIENGQVVALADKHELFPNTSFPTTGPDDAWYVENSCMKVNLSAPYSSAVAPIAATKPCATSPVVNVLFWSTDCFARSPDNPCRYIPRMAASVE